MLIHGEGVVRLRVSREGVIGLLLYGLTHTRSRKDISRKLTRIMDPPKNTRVLTTRIA